MQHASTAIAAEFVTDASIASTESNAPVAASIKHPRLPDTAAATTSATADARLGFAAHGACSLFFAVEELLEAAHTNLMPASSRHLYDGLRGTEAHEALFGIGHLRYYKVPMMDGTIHAEPPVAIQFTAGS